MRRAHVLRRTALSAVVAGLLASSVAGSATAPTTYTHGYDISWPQCSNDGNGPRAASVPTRDATYVILGLTHGAGHTVNPCLRAQLAWARDNGVLVGAYLVPSYPTSAQLGRATDGPFGHCTAKDVACRAGNDGASQAAAALATMRQVGLPAPMVWIDVEFRHYRPWSHNADDNARVIQGVVRGLDAASMPYGVYTTSYMWSHIVSGHYHVYAPNWLPGGGNNTPSDAKAMCDSTGSGGATWLVQYTHSFDEDLTCPVMDAYAGHPGPMYQYRDTVLVPGSSGDAVTALQKALRTVTVTGSYDLPTEDAVLAFQQSHNIQEDGIVDQDDWRALGAFELYGGHPFLLPDVAAPAS